MRGGSIKTSNNDAYEEIKQDGGQGGAYEMVDIPSRYPPEAVNVKKVYESPCSQPLPAIPRGGEEEEEEVYETIPGDM